MLYRCIQIYVIIMIYYDILIQLNNYPRHRYKYRPNYKHALIQTRDVIENISLIHWLIHYDSFTINLHLSTKWIPVKISIYFDLYAIWYWNKQIFGASDYNSPAYWCLSLVWYLLRKNPKRQWCTAFEPIIMFL